MTLWVDGFLENKNKIKKKENEEYIYIYERKKMGENGEENGVVLKAWVGQMRERKKYIYIYIRKKKEEKMSRKKR